MSDEPAVEYGLCCNCVARLATGIMMISRRGPTPGEGWGCFVCGLPSDGAVAVLCDECAEGLTKQDGADPRFVCTGYATEPGRTPFYELSDEVFTHDVKKHAADIEARAGDMLEPEMIEQAEHLTKTIRTHGSDGTLAIDDEAALAAVVQLMRLAYSAGARDATHEAYARMEDTLDRLNGEP